MKICENWKFKTNLYRSVEQLGYYIEAGLVEDDLTVNRLEIQVICHSSRCTTGYVNERIDNALRLYFDKFVVSKDGFKNTLGPFIGTEEHISQKSLMTFFQNYLLPGGSNFRKMSFQIVGNINCEGCVPMAATSICSKVAKYKSKKNFPGVKPNVDVWCPVQFILPEGLRDENGYFVTNFKKFTDSQECYGISRNDDSDTDSNNAEYQEENFSDESTDDSSSSDNSN